MIGVLGGMGPLATADFVRKVVESTPAMCDQDHLPMIVHNVPQIPDRSEAIVAGGDSPIMALMEGMQRLRSAGCECVAMPCNTAHHWYDELRSRSGLPILHIADAVVEALADAGVPTGAAICVLATEGALASGFYQSRLAVGGYSFLPIDVAGSRDVQKGIRLVKEGQISHAARRFRHVLRRAKRAGAQAAVLGCTEIALALGKARPDCRPLLIDSNAALAQACVRWWTLKHRAEGDRKIPGNAMNQMKGRMQT